MASRAPTTIVTIICWLAASGVVPACCWPTALAPSAHDSQMAEPHAHHHIHGGGSGLAVSQMAITGPVACGATVDAVLRSAPTSEQLLLRVAEVCPVPGLASGAEHAAAVVVLAPPGSGPPQSPPLIALRI